MKKIKEYIADIVICAMFVSPVITLAVIPYVSGFAQAYNGAVQRNVEKNFDSSYNGRDKLHKQKMEELKFKQKLLGEIRELSREDNLEEIVEFLKNR